MSAMDLLKAEISKKRKATQEIIEESGVTTKNGRARYFRQGDLLRIEEEKRRELQNLLDNERSQKEAKISFAQRSSDNITTDQEKQQSNSISNTIKSLSKSSLFDIKSRLRNLNQPVTMFGESDEERISRLAIVICEIRENEDDYRLKGPYVAEKDSKEKKGGSGAVSGSAKDAAVRNGLNAMQQQLETLEEEYLDRSDRVLPGDGAVEESGGDGKHESATSFVKGQIVTRYSATAGLSKFTVVYKYFRNLLKQWEWDLDDREDSEKNSSKGRIETKTQKQCKDYIRPLFKLCKKEEVPLDILDVLFKIVQHCEEGNFRMAHDVYLRGAIGNSAWPIGLTMVGIHERSGREKISTSKVAHVMNNELQRKYFTSVKRLMTYCQSKRTDVAPSMKSL